jgi:ubiquinone/menaquinone biosynthesis C-methylase UbiE
MDTVDQVKQPVLRMYMAHPYPSYTAEERRNIFAAELSRYRFLGLEPFLPNARIIDVGCGTSHRVMPIAQHFGVKEYVGFDHSTASLKVGGELAKELDFKNATLMEGDLFKLPFPDASFDIVISQGVIHHTSDPRTAFKELVRILKPGGFLNIYLYNKYNHWRHNMQKAKVNRLGGDDIDKKFEVAHRLYGTRPIEQMTPADIAGFYDQYCHPHKSDHTVGETLGWFDEENLQYWGSYPPLRFRDFVALAQYRGELRPQHPHFHTKMAERIVNMAMKLPKVHVPPPPFKRPGLINRFLWQAIYALQGSRGKYSGGPALCGRKVDSAAKTN